MQRVTDEETAGRAGRERRGRGRSVEAGERERERERVSGGYGGCGQGWGRGKGFGGRQLEEEFFRRNLRVLGNGGCGE